MASAWAWRGEGPSSVAARRRVEAAVASPVIALGGSLIEHQKRWPLQRSARSVMQQRT